MPLTIPRTTLPYVTVVDGPGRCKLPVVIPAGTALRPLIGGSSARYVVAWPQLLADAMSKMDLFDAIHYGLTVPDRLVELVPLPSRADGTLLYDDRDTAWRNGLVKYFGTVT